MYAFLRIMLRIAVLLAAYVAALAVLLVPYVWMVVLVAAVAVLCRRTVRYSAFGTARWAGPADVPHLLEGSGLIVGHMEGKVGKLAGLQALFDSRLTARQACQKFLASARRRQPKPLVRLTTAVHTAAFAPVGAGKSSSLVIPHLLTCPDSMVVVDFKGELAAATARARRAMGHRVVVLDPFRVTTREPDCFNPLDWIDRDSPTALDDCRDLAESLVVRTGQEKEPHWHDSAEVWIAAMVATTVRFAGGGDKSLQSVRSLLTDPEKMQLAIRAMCESDAWEGMLSRLGHQLTHFRDKELSSTLTTTNRFLRFLDTVAVHDSTKRSSFDPSGLLGGKTTVYLVLPPEHMRAQSALLRLWIGSLLRAVVRGGLSNRRVHFVLDEAASLGHMEALDDAVDKYRGYGVRLLLLYQSLGQLRRCWPEGQDQTLLSNVTQVFFGVNDQQTAEYVSARLGEETIVVASGGTSTSRPGQSSGQGGGTSHTTSDNWQQHGRKLLKPEEVTALDERVAITFTPGALPIWTRLVRYYEKEFRQPRPAGPVRACFDTICLFVSAAALAVLWTAALTHHTFR